MRHIIDNVLEFLKWPIAFIFFLSLPALFESLSFRYFKYASMPYFVLGAGILFFFISRTIADKSVRTSMQIIAHEFTHAFFALITFHKVNKISLNPDDSGGHMAFKGKGNWLITISPYFFPFLAFVYMIGVSIYVKFFPLNLTISYILTGFLGYFLGYHFDTVGSQIHDKQTDLSKVGYPFCVMFLPSANLWILGSILAFNSKGWAGIAAYNKLVFSLNVQYLDYLKSLI